MSEKYYEPLSLKYFDGLIISEIAQVLNLKEGTVKSLLSRGINKLRKMQKYGGKSIKRAYQNSIVEGTNNLKKWSFVYFFHRDVPAWGNV